MMKSEIRVFPNMFRGALFAALVIGLFSALGCANGEIRWGDPFDRAETLENAQHRYTVLVRWSKFQSAKDFVAAADRDAYIKRMKALKDARFTDYEAEPLELDDEKQTATIEVVYTLYTPSSPYEIEITEKQEWSRDGASNHWTVASTFDALHEIASN